mgnify:CR=1 FL=1
MLKKFIIIIVFLLMIKNCAKIPKDDLIFLNLLNFLNNSEFSNNSNNSYISYISEVSGIFDTSFGNNGFSFVDLYINLATYSYIGIESIHLQSNKILLAGICNNNSYTICFARFHSNDGKPDETLNPPYSYRLLNISNIDINQLRSSYTKFHLMSDEKILLVAKYNGALFFARFLSNGELDTSFNSPFGYKIVQEIMNNYNIETSLIQQNDKILVGGYKWGDNRKDLFLARFNQDGTFDNTFNGNGILILNLNPNYTNEVVKSILLTDDNKIFVGINFSYGNNYNYDSYKISLARFNQDGSLDITYNAPYGYKILDKIIGVEKFSLYKLFNNAGYYLYTFNSPNIYHINSEGAINNSFNSNSGILNLIRLLYSPTILVQNNNKFIYGGILSSGEIYLSRYNSDGSKDNSFLLNTIIKDYTQFHSAAMILAQDNKILIGGSSTFNNQYEKRIQFYVIRIK